MLKNKAAFGKILFQYAGKPL
ncbi:protein of unknown function [Burkholderia multivorans]